MRATAIQWVLNGCGMEAGSVTGGPVRFHEVSRRRACPQRLMTTPGGAAMLRRMGCALPMTVVRASLVCRREHARAARLWSYVLSARAGTRAMRLVPRPAAVVTVSDYFCDVEPALAAKRLHPGCRWVAWIHHQELPPAARPGNRLANTLTWRMQQASFRRIARHADQAWVLDTEAGDAVRDSLLALGMPAARIRRMCNGIDLEGIDAAPQPPRTVDAVMVGVRPNKGLHDIIPVWQEVQRLRPGTTLRLMGGMSGEQEVLRSLRRLGLDAVVEVSRPPGGYLAADAYYGALKQARLLFAPSHEEGWGIAVCEALACGLPVAAYDLPVYRRIYGEALATAPCFDTRALAATLVGLLDNAPRCRQLAAAGRARAEAYAWSAVAAADWQALGALCEPGEAAP